MKTDTVIDEHLTNEALRGQIFFDDTYDYKKMRDSSVKEKLEILDEMAGSAPAGIPDDIDIRQIRIE